MAMEEKNIDQIRYKKQGMKLYSCSINVWATGWVIGEDIYSYFPVKHRSLGFLSRHHLKEGCQIKI